jgi:hypothetical protein
MSTSLASRAEYRFGLVLVLLLTTFLFLMTGTSGSWAHPVTVLLSGLTFIAALFAANVSARIVRVAAIFSLLGFVASTSTALIGGSGAGASALVSAVLVGIAPVVIARSVLRRRVIDVQTVLAALCIYVLIGMLWGFIYTAIGELRSAPFFVQQPTATSADYLYFSFVTQLTVGYGDLTAAGNLSRACAVLEALLGQLYLVTIVAVLVSNLRPRQ